MTSIVSSGCGQPKNKHLTSNSPFGCGEDSFFINEGKGCGIADGVGGWIDFGVDSALIARQMMLNCNKLYVKNTTPNPIDTMVAAYNKIKDNREIDAGSTTCSLMYYNNENSFLTIAIIGDSGYIIIRDDKIIYQDRVGGTPLSNPPDQLSIIPTYLENMGMYITDWSTLVSHAHYCKPGDKIILATDGFWDNVYLDVLEKYMSSFDNSLSVDEIAKKLVDFALENYTKPDDITVVVSIIQET